VLAELARRWGARIIQADGTADRAAIASMVFALSPEGAEERRFLESVTHPRIAARVREELDRCRERGTTVVVLDAPVLLEAGWESLCDRLWFVEVDRAERVRRALARGWTETQFTAREASQWPVSQKRKLADQVIDNSGSFEHTFAQLQHFWHSLNPLPPE
jgi:dephospho-CoA kinase